MRLVSITSVMGMEIEYLLFSRGTSEEPARHHHIGLIGLLNQPIRSRRMSHLSWTALEGGRGRGLHLYHVKGIMTEWIILRRAGRKICAKIKGRLFNSCQKDNASFSVPRSGLTRLFIQCPTKSLHFSCTVCRTKQYMIQNVIWLT